MITEAFPPAHIQCIWEYQASPGIDVGVMPPGGYSISFIGGDPPGISNRYPLLYQF